METLILPVIHVLVLVGLLVYFVKSPFGKYVSNRYQTISEGLNKSKAQVAEAGARKKEIENKLAGLSQEKNVIFSEWKDREALQIKAIREGSQRILAQMTTEAAANKAALEDFTKKDTIRNIGIHTVELAKKKVLERLSPDTHKKLNEKFTQEVAGV